VWKLWRAKGRDVPRDTVSNTDTVDTAVFCRYALRNMRPAAYCYTLCSVVCVSFFLLDTSMSHAKTAEPMTDEVGTRISPRNHVLDGNPHISGEGAIWGKCSLDSYIWVEWAIWGKAAWCYCSLLLPTALTREIMGSPPSVCLSIPRFVRLFPLYLRNRLTVDLELMHVSKSWPQLAGDWRSRL